MGMKGSSPLLKEESKFCYAKIITKENTDIMFEVRRRGQLEHYSPEQICSMILKKLRKNYEEQGIACKDVVISVPHFFTVCERQAILDAAKIIDLNIVKLMNENLASGFEYGLFRMNDFTDTPRYVAFTDMGHCKTKVTIIAFTKTGMNIVSQVYDRYLGARNFDWLIMEKGNELFQKKYKLNAMENPKCIIRMLEAIEKTRKVLSASDSTHLSIECLYQERDLEMEIKRTDFEKMIAPLNDKVTELCQKALKLSKLELKQIHSVELVGEATRIPSVKQAIQAGFPNIEVVRTLNSSECVARGCAVMSAKLSPMFKVKDYNVTDSNVFPIEVCYTTPPKNGQTQIKTSLLFDVGTNFPVTKSLTFENRKDPIDVSLKYAESSEIHSGAITLLGNFKVNSPEPKEPKWSLIIKIRNDQNMIPCLQVAEISEDYMEEKKVVVRRDAPPKYVEPPKKEESKAQEGKDQPPSKEAQKPDQISKEESKNEKTQKDVAKKEYEKMQDSTPEEKAEVKKEIGKVEEKKEEKKEMVREEPPQQEYEIQQVQRNRRTNMNFKYEIHGLNVNKINELIDIEKKIQQEDNIIINTNRKKVELEGYIYDMRSKLTDDSALAKYENDKTKIEILEQISKSETWLFDEGRFQSLEVYEKKLNEMKVKTDIIINRKKYYENVTYYFVLLNNCIVG